MKLVYFVKQTKKVDHNTSHVQMQSNIQFNNKKTVLHLNKLRTQIQKKKLSPTIYGILSYKPCGLIWNDNDYSCGYDALFTILFSLWTENPQYWRIKYHPAASTKGQVTCHVKQWPTLNKYY
jgi:hypothetical protein